MMAKAKQPAPLPPQKAWDKSRSLSRGNEPGIVRWLRGPYAFLSRGYKHWKVWMGPTELQPFPSLDHYMLVMRAVDGDRKKARQAGTRPKDLRRLYRLGKVTQRADWNDVRNALVWEALCSRFSPFGDKDGRLKLICSHPEVQQIIDSNVGCNNYWGVCICPECDGTLGLNIYGQMLLQIRAAILEGRL